MATIKLNTQAYDNARIVEQTGTNAWQGKVVWSWSKSLWITMMTLVGVVGALFTLSLENSLVFLISTAITLNGDHRLTPP